VPPVAAALQILIPESVPAVSPPIPWYTTAVSDNFTEYVPECGPSADRTIVPVFLSSVHDEKTSFPPPPAVSNPAFPTDGACIGIANATPFDRIAPPTTIAKTIDTRNNRAAFRSIRR
jgi:hypothetical protein